MLVAQRKIQEEVWIPALDGCEGNARGGLKQVPAVHQYIQHWYATTHPENSSVVMIAHGVGANRCRPTGGSSQVSSQRRLCG